MDLHIPDLCLLEGLTVILVAAQNVSKNNVRYENSISIKKRISGRKN
jgi:hypothetical protein